MKAAVKRGKLLSQLALPSWFCHLLAMTLDKLLKLSILIFLICKTGIVKPTSQYHWETSKDAGHTVPHSLLGTQKQPVQASCHLLEAPLQARQIMLMICWRHIKPFIGKMYDYIGYCYLEVIFKRFILCIWVFCLHINTYTICVPAIYGSQKRVRSLGTWVTEGCEPACGFRELNMVPLQK